MPIPPITEADAVTLMRGFESLPPDRQAVAKEKLAAYRAYHEEQGSDPFEETQRAKRLSLDSYWQAWEDPKKLDAENGLFEYADKSQPGLGDELRQGELKARFLSRKFRVPLERARKEADTLGMAYQMQAWNEGAPLELPRWMQRAKMEVDDEKNTFALASDLGESVTRQTLLSGLPGKGWEEWKAKASAMPGWKADREAEYFKTWQAAQKQLSDDMGPNAGLVRRTVRALQESTGIDDPAAAGASWQRPEYELRDLLIKDPAAYKKALKVIQRVAVVSAKENKDGVTGWLQKASESLSRGVESVTLGATEGVQRFGSAPLASALGMEDVARLNDAGARVESDLRKIAAGVVDPIQRKDWIDTMTFGFLESAPTMVAGMTGIGGTAVLASGYGSEALSQFEDRGWSGAGAKSTALLVGGISAAVESASEALGGTAWGRSLTARLGAGADSGWLTRFLVNTGARGVTEFSEELVQDNVAAGVQSLLDQVGADVGAPAPFIDEVKMWVKEQGGDTALVVLPLALLGAGMTTSSQISKAKVDAMTADVARMAAVIGNEAAARIAAITDPAQRLTEFQSTYQSTSAANRLEYLKASSELAKIRAELLRDDAPVTVSRLRDGSWSVTSADGSVRATTAEEAASIRAEMMMDGAQGVSDAVNAWLEAPAMAGAEVTFRDSALREIDGELLRIRGGGIAAAASPEEQASVSAQKAGLGMTDDVEVNGSNQLRRESTGETAGRVYAAIEVNNSTTQQTIVTAVHEGLEANYKRGLANGALDEASIVKALGRLQTALDWTAIERRAKARGAMGTDAGQSLTLKGRIDDAVSGKATPDAIRETAIELAVMDVMERDWNGGRTGMQAGTFARAIDSMIANEADAATLTALGKLKRWMRAVRKWLTGVFGTVKAIEQAKKDGKLKEGDDWTTFVDDLLNLEDSKFARAVAGETAALLNLVPADSRAQPTTDAKQTVLADGTLLVGPSTFSITAYHGTPHKVDRFTTAKIGTGEGAQAYGWGLYFAENRDVGEGYRDKLAQWTLLTSDGKIYDDRKELKNLNVRAVLNKNGSIDEAVARARSVIESIPGTQGAELALADIATLEKLKQSGGLTKTKGNLYTVELLPNEDDLLDWDKPLSEQSEKVKAALESFYRLPISKIGKSVRDLPIDNRQGVKALAEVGIPGIKYLDGNSRDNGKGTRNYVIFDENLVRILEENGMAVDRSFSLTPAGRIGLVENRLAIVLNQDSEAARKFASKASERLALLKRRYAGIPAAKSKAQLDAQQRGIVEGVRRDLEDQFVGEVEARMGGVNELPTSFYDHPLFESFFTRRGRQIFGRLTPPAAWRAKKIIELKEGRIDTIPGDYDGAKDLPQWVFRGGRGDPDKILKEMVDDGALSEPDIDAMWSALGSMLDDVASNKEQYQAYREALKDARNRAKEEAEFEGRAWRAEEDTRQELVGNPRRQAVADAAAVEAVLGAMPAEARAKLPRGLMAYVLKANSEGGLARAMTKVIIEADRALQRYWKAKNIESSSKLVMLGQGKTAPGKKPRGSATPAVHRYFSEVAKVMNLETERLEGMREALEKDIASFAGTDKEIEAIERLQIFDDWSGFNNLHVKAQEDVLERGWQLYQNGRNQWRDAEEQRLIEQRKVSADIVGQVGQGLYERLSDAAARGRDKKTWLQRFGVETRDFEGVLSALLGRDHAITRQWSDKVRKGLAAKDDALRLLRGRWQAALDEAMPGTSKAKQRLRLWEMRTKLTISVEIQEEQARTDLTSEERQKLREDGLMKYVGSKVKLSEDQALYLTMTARQNQYVEPLAAAGWTPAVLEEIEGKLSLEAKALREFMAREYDAGHAGLNAVMERVNGISLPKIPNYSPGRFYNWGQEKPLDVMGTGVVSSGFASGFLVDRKTHLAQVKLASALGVFWTHQNESLHWQNLAEPVREMRGVLRNPDVKRALDGAWGDFGNALFEQWMQALEGNGIKQAAGAWDKLITWATSNFAVGRLAYNLGTIAKTATAVLNTALDVPFGLWLMGAGRIAANPSAFSDVYKSDFIQRRLDAGYSPEIRVVLDQFWGAKPGQAQAIIEKGMEPIGWTDAFFTSVSAAVAYESRAVQAERLGMTPEQAHALGMEAAESAVARTAQPSTVDRRSMLELRQNAAGRMLMLFMTEARQKAALWAEAWGNVLKGKATTRDKNILLVSHLLIAPMLQAITSVIKDWRDGPDDGDDDKAWEATDFLVAAMLGPIDGIPFVGAAIKDGLAGRTFGGKGSDVLGSPVTAVIATFFDLLTDLMDDKNQTAAEEIDKLLRLASQVGGAPGVGANVIKQTKDTVESFQ